MKNILLKKEFLAIITNKKLLIPIIAVMFIPVLYSGMFLWAFWDPYEKLVDLPVAVVNQDKGAEFDGKDLQLGADLVGKLKDSKDFNFKFVNKRDGYNKLKDQKYYMLIEIPKDFSENATTLLDKNPQKLKLVYVPNESYNFLSAQIGGTAVERIKAALSEKITETYAETMFDKVGEMKDGLVKAGDGAGKLNDGSNELKNGSAQLRDGLATLAEKSIEFNNGMKKANSGADQVASGSKSLAAGMGQLQDGHEKLEAATKNLQSGSEQLAAGITKAKAGIDTMNSKMPAIVGGGKQLQAGADSLAGNLQTWKTGSDTLNSGAKELDAGILQLKGNLDKMGLSDQQKAALNGYLDQFLVGSGKIVAGSGRLSASAEQLSGGAQQLAGKLGELNAGQQQLQAGISQLAEGSVPLQAGANKLAAGERAFSAGMQMYSQKFAEAKAGVDKLAGGSTELAGGMNQLATGSKAMSSGAGQLADGSEKLSDGTNKLANGSKELADKLNDGAKEASKVDADGKTFNMMAEPVKVKNEKINKVPNYGTGFAPYFLSLGLFVGALLLSIVFPLREPAGVPANAFSWFMSKFGLLAGIGVVQAILADLILLVGLGLDVQSVPKFILFSIITSLTFIALVQFLVTVMGDPGRFVAIIILILQLTTSAGTFPIELIPNFLQHFNMYLPMTYSVSGFKSVISSGDFSMMWNNAMILVIYIIAFSLGTLAYFNFKHKRQFRTLVDQ